MAPLVEHAVNPSPLPDAVPDAAAAKMATPLERLAEPQGAFAPEPTQAPPSVPAGPASHPSEPPPVSVTLPPAGFGASPPGPIAPPPAQDIAGVAAGLLPFGAPPAYPERATLHEARGEFPGVGAMTTPQHQPLGQAPTHPQAPAAYGFGSPATDPVQNNYRLLEALARQADLPGQAPQPPSYSSPAFAGTFGALLGAETSVPMQSFGQQAPQQSAFHHTGGGQSGSKSGPGPAGFSPAVLPTGNWPSPVPPSALLPAAMVTLPLAEVMRLVAVGAPVVSPPFAAFRVSGGAPIAR